MFLIWNIILIVFHIFFLIDKNADLYVCGCLPVNSPLNSNVILWYSYQMIWEQDDHILIVPFSMFVLYCFGKIGTEFATKQGNKLCKCF